MHRFLNVNEHFGINGFDIYQDFCTRHCEYALEPPRTQCLFWNKKKEITPIHMYYMKVGDSLGLTLQGHCQVRT